MGDIRRSDEAKRARELEQFERFAAACACVPPGPRSQPEPPEPDVVIGPPYAQIGVELTDLHPSADGEAQRRREGEQAKVVAAARDAYLRGGYPPVHVWISWIRHDRLANRAALADRIASIVAAHPPGEGGLHEIGTGFEPLAPDLPITRIAVAEASTYHASDWRDGDMHEVGFCTAEDVQARIAHEDAKVDRYLGMYAARWLVLVVGAAGPSTWGCVAADVRQARFRSRYDRVFVFEYVYARSHELRLIASH